MKSLTKTNRYSRRALLKGLGLGGAMLPLLHSERAKAANTPDGFPKRLVTITWTNGLVPRDFYPAAVGDLTAATAPPLPPILKPLETWKSKLLLPRLASKAVSPVEIKVMMDNGKNFDGHNSYPALLTGAFRGAGPSIDQIVTNQLATEGVTSKQLNISVRSGNGGTSWRAAGQRNSGESDPSRLFNRLFAGVGTPAPMMNTIRARRQSVLDLVKGELGAFANRVGTEDKVRIQAHLESVRQIETELATMPSPSNGVCTPPMTPPTGLNFNQVANYPTQVKLMLDIVAAAVKCDVARTVTVDLIDDGGGNSLTFPWLSIPSPDFHAIAHSGSGAYAQKTPIDTWYYTQVASMVKQLAEFTEGTQTALDHSVVVVTNDMNEGSNHWVSEVPFLLIGSCGGFFKTGRVVGFAQKFPNNQILTTLAHAMGANVESVGQTYTGNVDAALTS